MVEALPLLRLDWLLLALGSDTADRFVNPAVTAWSRRSKPTYGRVSRYGLVAFASSLDRLDP